MEQTPEDKKLNPQITELEIGVRYLRKVKLYPLSLGDQLELSDIIQQGLAAFFQIEQGNEESLATFTGHMFNLVRENIDHLIGLLVLDEDPKKVLFDITDAQIEEAVRIIYRVNYAPLKNLKGLLGDQAKGETDLQSGRP